MKISVSFLTCKDKAKDLKKLNLTDADYIHVDYMDGKFVKYISLPYRELKKVYKYTSKRLDIHLMAAKPDRLIKKFALLNAEYITIHVEIKRNIKKILSKINAYGIKAGLAINPTTDINVLKDYLEDIDLIIVMGVEPGKGGQEFIEETSKRVKEIKKMIKESGRDISICVDGGINNETKKKVKTADILVSGSYVVNSKDFQEAITSLR